MFKLRVGLFETVRIGHVYLRLCRIECSPGFKRTGFDVALPDHVRLVTPETGIKQGNLPIRVLRNSGQSIVAVWDDLQHLALITVESVEANQVRLLISAPQSLRIKLLSDQKVAS